MLGTRTARAALFPSHLAPRTSHLAHPSRPSASTRLRASSDAAVHAAATWGRGSAARCVTLLRSLTGPPFSPKGRASSPRPLLDRLPPVRFPHRSTRLPTSPFKLRFIRSLRRLIHHANGNDGVPNLSVVDSKSKSARAGHAPGGAGDARARSLARARRLVHRFFGALRAVTFHIVAEGEDESGSFYR